MVAALLTRLSDDADCPEIVSEVMVHDVLIRQREISRLPPILSPRVSYDEPATRVIIARGQHRVQADLLLTFLRHTEVAHLLDGLSLEALEDIETEDEGIA